VFAIGEKIIDSHLGVARERNGQR